MKGFSESPVDRKLTIRRLSHFRSKEKPKGDFTHVRDVEAIEEGSSHKSRVCGRKRKGIEISKTKDHYSKKFAVEAKRDDAV